MQVSMRWRNENSNSRYDVYKLHVIALLVQINVLTREIVLRPNVRATYCFSGDSAAYAL